MLYCILFIGCLCDDNFCTLYLKNKKCLTDKNNKVLSLIFTIKF